MTYVEEIEFLIAREKQLQSNIRVLSLTRIYEQNIKVLTSVPSIGLIAGMTMLTELGNIKRFKKFDRLCSYCGLTPNCFSSGETERVTGLSRRGNPFIKIILIEWAWMAIRKDPGYCFIIKNYCRG